MRASFDRWIKIHTYCTDPYCMCRARLHPCSRIMRIIVVPTSNGNSIGTYLPGRRLSLHRNFLLEAGKQKVLGDTNASTDKCFCLLLERKGCEYQSQSQSQSQSRRYQKLSSDISFFIRERTSTSIIALLIEIDQYEILKRVVIAFGVFPFVPRSEWSGCHER